MDTGIAAHQTFRSPLMANYTKQMQKIVQEYRDSGQTWPASAKSIADWAITTGRWEMPAAAIAPTTSPRQCERNTIPTPRTGAFGSYIRPRCLAPWGSGQCFGMILGRPRARTCSFRFKIGGRELWETAGSLR